MSIVPAAEIPFAEQAAVANRAFAGYVAGWADLDAAALARFLNLQGADIFYSRFVEHEGALAGLGYINRTGDIPRLAAMALVPEARGTGAATLLLTHLCEEARARGDRAMVLEVIEQNPRAHAFYRREGFRELGRLVGWRGSCQVRETDTVAEVAVLDALQTRSPRDYPELPWAITRYAVAKTIGARAFRSHETAVIISISADDAPVRVHALLSPSEDWRVRRDALAATMRHFPKREFFTPAVFPEEFGPGVFEPLGFRQEPISQFLMRRDF